ncbi:MAG: hypothetical protein GY760_04880 [Deltaproteobacteria bacterium]|nr:hypothetical protein [Deltaproteobacteria bacterium]
MKILYEWAKNNISNLFTFLGIFLTIYFSIFYIPGYVKETQNEKLRGINESLIETVQELIFNNEKLDVKNISMMIKGKELRFKISYPYSIDELLTLTQERFLENKFIPLKERKKLFDKIETIKTVSSNNINTDPKDSKSFDYSVITSWVSVLAGIVGVLVSILALLSTLFKLKNEKEMGIEEDVKNREEEIQSNVVKVFAYEKMIEEVLKELGFNYQTSATSRDYGYDFLVTTDKKKTFVLEAKYYHRNKIIPLNMIYKILGVISKTDYAGILVTNCKLSKKSDEIVKQHNKKESNKPFYIVHAETREELSENLRKFIK